MAALRMAAAAASSLSVR